MMERKEIIRNLLIILLVFILAIIPWASVIGIQDPDLLGAVREIQHTMFFVIITCLLLKIFYDIYMKPLKQEVKEQEIKEAEQKDRKQLIFKPTISVILFFLFLIVMGIVCFIQGIFPSESNGDRLGWIFGSFFLIGLSFYLWYKTPVLIFAEDSVQIESYLFHVLGIDGKTIIRYADITSVSPNPKLAGNMWGVESKHSIVISTNGTTQEYSLFGKDDDIIAKIYLRFKEQLGDKVRLE